jgi:hypothetical protein
MALSRKRTSLSPSWDYRVSIEHAEILVNYVFKTLLPQVSFFALFFFFQTKEWNYRSPHKSHTHDGLNITSFNLYLFKGGQLPLGSRQLTSRFSKAFLLRENFVVILDIVILK